MPKTFYYDYFSLRNASIEDWHRDFFWPVSWAETQKINEAFRKFHVELINQLGDSFEGDCLLIAYHISGHFVKVANHYLAVRRLIDSGYHIEDSSYLKLVPLLQREDNFEFKHENLLNEIYNSKAFLRNLKSSLKFNFGRGQYNLLKQIKSESIASAGVISHEFLKNRDEWIKIITSGWLIKKKSYDADKIVLSSIQTFTNISEAFVNFCSEYMRNNFKLLMSEKINDALRRFSFSYLIKVGGVYEYLLLSTEHLQIKNFYSSTAGNPYTRALSLAVARNGGDTIGFPHGYFICHHSGTRPSFHEFATVKKFVAYTRGSVELFKKNISLNPPPRGHTTEILSDGTSKFNELFKKWNKKPAPNNIKTVMVMELSLIPEWAGYYAAEAMVNYHFYYSLCKSLSKMGYCVIFKRRPKDLSWQGLNIFERIPNLRIIYDPFEAPGVLEQCDAIIIQYAHSSTFNYSICSNKIVIYVDTGWEPWFPEVYSSMAKRCGVLHCKYDKLNRAFFDEKELFEILNRKPGLPEVEYFEKYLS